MNLIETTIVGSVAAIVGGAVAWFTKGKFESDSLQVKQAQAVLAMWQATSENQNKELTQLRNEVVSLDRKSTRLNSSHVSESRMPSSA